MAGMTYTPALLYKKKIIMLYMEIYMKDELINIAKTPLMHKKNIKCFREDME